MHPTQTWYTLNWHRIWDQERPFQCQTSFLQTFNDLTGLDRAWWLFPPCKSPLLYIYTTISSKSFVSVNNCFTKRCIYSLCLINWIIITPCNCRRVTDVRRRQVRFIIVWGMKSCKAPSGVQGRSPEKILFFSSFESCIWPYFVTFSAWSRFIFFVSPRGK